MTVVITVTYVVFLVMFLFLGSLGNGLIIVVFARKRRKISTDIFILALAAIDLLSCVLLAGVIVWTLVPSLQDRVFCRVLYFVRRSTAVASSVQMIIIACDRYNVVCSRQWLVTKQRSVIAVLAGLAYSFSTQIYFLLFGDVTDSDGQYICGYAGPFWLGTIMDIVVDASFVTAILVSGFSYGNIYLKIKQHRAHSSSTGQQRPLNISAREQPVFQVTRDLDTNSADNQSTSKNHAVHRTPPADGDSNPSNRKCRGPVRPHRGCSVAPVAQIHPMISDQVIPGTVEDAVRGNNVRAKRPVQTTGTCSPENTNIPDCSKPSPANDRYLTVQDPDRKLAETFLNSRRDVGLIENVPCTEIPTARNDNRSSVYGMSSKDEGSVTSHPDKAGLNNVQGSHSDEQNVFRRRQSREGAMTYMLLIVTVVFVVSLFPVIVIENFPTDMQVNIQKTVLGQWIVIVLYQLRMVNHVSNAFVYLFVNNRFRRSAKELLCKRA
ncbi:uncharacterized protein [Diadema setosum]|uniref:uncharacterized protein n=1 Tax=Diadema setosum TaxID=31175 RepID=UPI003B3B8B8C